MVLVQESINDVTERRSIIFQPLKHIQLPPIRLSSIGLAPMRDFPDKLQDTRCQHILDTGLILCLQLRIKAVEYILGFDFLPGVITQEIEAIPRPGVIFPALEVSARKLKSKATMPIVLV